MPAVSIITPAYNSSATIQETVNSVLRQTFQDWELLIVDDASEDATWQVINAEAGLDDRIRVFRQPGNMGAAAARNLAMQEARGRYIAFLDADDLWPPEKLDRQLAFMRRKDAVFSFTSYRMITEAGDFIGNRVQVPATIDYSGLLKNTIIGCLTVMLDSNRTGPLKMENLRSGQDYTLWFHLLRDGMVAYGLDEDLARYRLVSGSVSRNKIKAARRMWKLYRVYERLSLPYSVWCFANYAWNAVKKSRF